MALWADEIEELHTEMVSELNENRMELYKIDLQIAKCFSREENRGGLCCFLSLWIEPHQLAKRFRQVVNRVKYSIRKWTT